MSSAAISRACESCRSSKVRCRPDPDSTLAAQEGRCQRCAAAGKACTYTPPRRTKRKRTDVRVRELENELKALGELMRAGKARIPGDRPADLADVDCGVPEGAAARPRPPLSAHEQLPGGSSASNSSPPVLDPVDSGMISIDYAARLFDRYVSDLAPQRPLVVFPPGTRPSQVRTDKPALFLAILVAASGSLDTDLCRKLNDVLLQLYAKRIVIRGEKSVELIQAILVSTNWHSQSGNYDHMKFYQHLHMAATIAVDIDLGEPSTWTAGDDAAVQPLAIERQRTLLGCYICCSSISLNYLRPNMFPFTPQMEECIEVLETSPSAAPSDPALASWARLQHILDLSDAALDLRGHSAKVNLADAGVQLGLLNCTKQLESWRKRTPEATLNEPLLMQYHAVYCFLHQISLYAEYSPADFKPPYTISLPPIRTTDLVLTPAHLSSVTKCISSAQAVLDTFLSMPTPVLVCGPVIVYARMGYAAVILTKIHTSALLNRGALSGVVDPGVTRVRDYLERVVRHLEEVGRFQRSLVSVWLPVLSSLRDWVRQHLRPGAGDSGEDGVSELIRPLRLFSLVVDGAPGDSTTGHTAANIVQNDQIALAEARDSLMPGNSEEPGGSISFRDDGFPDHCDFDMFSGMVPGDLDEWIAASAHLPDLDLGGPARFDSLEP